MDKFTEKTLHSERVYTGRIIDVDLVDIELPDGRKAKREVVRHGNAVAVLARRPDGKFVFVKQYRKAAEEALVEVIAGGLEKGEDPEAGARRETAEETGFTEAMASDSWQTDAERLVRQLLSEIRRGVFWPPSPADKWQYDYAGILYDLPEFSVNLDWLADQRKRGARA